TPGWRPRPPASGPSSARPWRPRSTRRGSSWATDRSSSASARLPPTRSRGSPGRVEPRRTGNVEDHPGVTRDPEPAGFLPFLAGRVAVVHDTAADAGGRTPLERVPG